MFDKCFKEYGWSRFPAAHLVQIHQVVSVKLKDSISGRVLLCAGFC